MKAIVKYIKVGTVKSTATFYDEFVGSMVKFAGKEIDVNPLFEGKDDWFYGEGWQWHRDWLIFSPSLDELKSKAIELCIRLHKTMDSESAYLCGKDVQALRAIGRKALAVQG